nr:BEL1-like homeodomain protein 1 isoform X1 [Ipomoea batatas]
MAMEGDGFSSREAEQKEATELLLQKRRCFFHFSCLGATGRDGFGSKWSTMMRAVEIEKSALWFRGIRALNRLRHCENQGKFRYDPHSYALNFDEGPEHNENFSVRAQRRILSSKYLKATQELLEGIVYVDKGIKTNIESVKGAKSQAKIIAEDSSDIEAAGEG